MIDVAHKAAVRVMNWLHVAEDVLVGACVHTFNGEVGTCKGVRLDDLHGLCFTFDDPRTAFEEIECGTSRKWYPVSTIRNRS